MNLDNIHGDYLETIMLILEKEISDIQRQLTKLPTGRLNVQINGKCSQWRASFWGKTASTAGFKNWRFMYTTGKENKKKSVYYLPKNETKIARDLVRREYYEKRLDVLEEVLCKLAECNAETNKILAKLESVNRAEKLIEYKSATSAGKPNYDESAIYDDGNGDKMRSRVEIIIGKLLEANGFTFEYEKKIEVGSNGFEKYIYPDFHITHPRTGKKYIWEHFGRLDNPKYVSEAAWKIKMLTEKGYVLSDTLLITGENGKQPLNMNAIYRTIEFLKNDM